MPPSKAHQDLTSRAIGWLSARATFSGLRGARELWLDRGYVADAVVMLGFQNRFFLEYCRRWGRDPVRVYATTPERDRNDPAFGAAGQTPDEQIAAGAVPCDFTVVIEAKASRSDYLATFGQTDRHANRQVPRGHMHYVVAAKGVVEPEEVPDPWGLLLPRGSGTTQAKWPDYCPQPAEAIHAIGHRILWKPPGTQLYGSGSRTIDEAQADVRRARWDAEELVRDARRNADRILADAQARASEKTSEKAST